MTKVTALFAWLNFWNKFAIKSILVDYVFFQGTTKLLHLIDNKKKFLIGNYNAEL